MMKIDGASQRKEVRLNARVKGIVSRAIESAGSAPAVEEHLAILRQLLLLEVGKFDMEVLFEKQVGGLDVAVENASGMDPRDGLGSLSALGQPLLDRRGRLARLEQVVGYVSVRGAFQVKACVREALEPYDALMWSDLEKLPLHLQTGHVPAGG